MRRLRRLAIAGAAVVAGLWAYRGLRKPVGVAPGELPRNAKPPEGRFVCPAEMGVPRAPTASLRTNDFVVVRLARKDGANQEWAWAEVLSVSPDRSEALVQLRGQLGAVGAQKLNVSGHGFRIGSRRRLPLECVFDTLRPASPDLDERGKIYCGVLGQELVGRRPLQIARVSRGDQVQIVVSTKVAPREHMDELWVLVEGVSMTGNVIYGTIVSEPGHPTHGFRPGMDLQFTYDCIFGRR